MLYQINMKVFPADWERLGKRAGPIRNALIVDYVDMVLAFPGDGTGTQHAISLAERRACPMFVYQV